MDYKDFEDKLSGQFQGFQPEGLDSDAMWAEVEAGLSEKKKRRFLWLFLSGLVLVGFSVTLMFFINDNENSDSSAHTNIQNTQQTVSKSVTKKTLVSEVTADAEVVEAVIIEEVEAVIEVEPKEEKSAEHKPESSKWVHVINEERTSFKTSNLKQEIVAPATESVMIKEDMIVANKSQALNTTIIETSVIPTPTVFQEQNSTESKEDPAEKTATPVKEETAKVTLANSNKEDKADAEVISDEDVIEKSAYPITDEIELIETSEKLAMEEKQVVKNLSPISVGLSFGYYRPKARYSDGALGVLREELESDLEAVDASLALRYNLGDSWGISTGLTWSRINQGSANTSSYIREETSDDVVIEIINYFTGPQEVTGPGVIQYEVVQNYQRYLYYESIAIPVEIYFKPLRGNKWQLELSAGYEYSLTGYSKGFQQEADKTEYDLSTDVNNRLKSKSSHYALAGVDAAYNISKRVTWQIGLQAKWATTGLYEDKELFQKQFLLPGIRTGVFFNL